MEHGEASLGGSPKTGRAESLSSTSTVRTKFASKSLSCFSYLKYETGKGRRKGKGGKKRGRRKKGRKKRKRRRFMVLGCVVGEQSLSIALAVNLRVTISSFPKQCQSQRLHVCSVCIHMHPHK